jgi:hypothetical protein
MQVCRDAAGSEMIVLAQVENLADDLARRGAGRMPRRSRPVAEAGVPVLGVPFPPFVERFAVSSSRLHLEAHQPKEES